MTGSDQPRLVSKPCRRCGAPVVWSALPRGGGRQAFLLPVDAEPVPPTTPTDSDQPAADPRTAPDVVLTLHRGHLPSAKILDNPADRFGRVLYRRHVRTCPFPPPHEATARARAAEKRRVS